MESRTIAFQTIKCSDNYSILTCVMSELGSEYCPNFLGHWCSDVSIKHVTNFYLEVIQGGNGQCQANHLTRDDTGVCDGCWGLGPMATGNESSIGDSQLCFFRFDSMRTQPCACWMAALTVTGKPTGFYNRINKGWSFIHELKYEVFMLPR